MILLSSSGDNVQTSDDRSDTLIVGTVEGVFVLRRAVDGEWSIVGRGLEGCNVSALTVDDRGVIAATHGVGLARSDDGGKSWRWINQGITQFDVWAVRSGFVSGRHIILAGTMPAHLFRSDDGGEHWRELPAVASMPTYPQWFFPPPPHQGHVKDIVIQDGRILVGIEIGALLSSKDGGETFEALPVDPSVAEVDLHRILVHPDRPGRIIISNGVVGMMRSNDDGRTWTRGPFPPGLNYPDPLVLHPTDPDLVFVAGGVGWPPHWYALGRARGKISRSRDGGLTWERLLGGLPDGQRALYGGLTLAAWKGGFDLFAADSDGQLFESCDGGDTWRVIAEVGAVSKGDFYRALAKNRPRLANVDDMKFSEAGAKRVAEFSATR